MQYKKEKRELVLGLMSHCPFKEPDNSCPLTEIRSADMSIKKDLALKSMDGAQIEKLYRYHEHCSCIRDNPHLVNFIKSIDLSSAQSA